MTRTVSLNGEPLTVEAVHRLALAVVPIDALTRAPIGPRALVGREPRSGCRARRRRHGDVLDPIARRLDIAFENPGSSASKLRHRLDLPLPPLPPTGAGPPPLTEEMVLRISEPSRRYVPRRLTVPVWTRRAVERIDEPQAGPYVPTAARVVRPWLHPGSAYQPATGMTGVRGTVRRAGSDVAWARVEAIDTGPPESVVARAHGDDRGEFLLLMPTTASTLQPGGSTFTVELAFWAPPAGATDKERDVTHDPLRGLTLEDAVDSTPGALDGAIDGRVLRGEVVPPGYVSLGPRRVVSITIGAVVHPVPFAFG